MAAEIAWPGRKRDLPFTPAPQPASGPRSRPWNGLRIVVTRSPLTLTPRVPKVTPTEASTRAFWHAMSALACAALTVALPAGRRAGLTGAARFAATGGVTGASSRSEEHTSEL